MIREWYQDYSIKIRVKLHKILRYVESTYTSWSCIASSNTNKLVKLQIVAAIFKNTTSKLIVLTAVFFWQLQKCLKLFVMYDD